MIGYGFDETESPNSIWSIKQHPSKEKAVGILLFSFGTIPSADSVAPNCHEESVKYIQRKLERKIDEIWDSEGAEDLRYVAAKLVDTLQEGNTHIRKITEITGNGIYIGGWICYIREPRYLVIPFGGARTYLWNGTNLVLKGDIEAHEYVTDALGCCATWEPTVRVGELPENRSIFLTTDLLVNLSECESALAAGHEANTYSDTNAMLLNRDLKGQQKPPTAVMEFFNRG